VLRRRALRRHLAAIDANRPDRELYGVYPLTANGAAGALVPWVPGTLHIRSRRSRDQRIVELAGELNLRTRDPLADVLEEAREGDAGQIVLDLSDLVAIDHAGLDTILTAHLRASDELKLFLIVPGPPAVQRVLDRVQGPFTYATRRGYPSSARARSRGRRAGLSARPGAGVARPHGVRRRG
jgi:anti-anti-sigma factor